MPSAKGSRTKDTNLIRWVLQEKTKLEIRMRYVPR
jgi:hypothetical protein